MRQQDWRKPMELCFDGSSCIWMALSFITDPRDGFVAHFKLHVDKKPISRTAPGDRPVDKPGPQLLSA
ncbi:F-Box/Lrr-Repeat Protein 3 [Manis pentadactyla]|nr:F-Box/Lrr-Repeat Protein 3 [Manis pentadactyla]